ncbi:MAG: hypothetical protein JNN27_23935 [Planctomycetes bacterium]|nr:hypothetical protein [Planctomycetota bacterium]
MSRSGKLSLAAALAVCAVFVVLLLRSATETSDAAEPNTHNVASPSGSAALDAPAEASASSPAVPAALRTATSGAVNATPENPVAAAASTITLYGYVRPDPRRSALQDESIAVVVTNALGVRWMVKCASDGAFSLTGLAPGEYWLSAYSTIDGSGRARAQLAPGAEAHLVDVTLTLERDVWIKIVDAQGEPVKFRGVRAVAVATRERPGAWFTAVRGSLNERFGVGNFWDNGYASEKRPPEYFGRVVLYADPPVWISLLNRQFVIDSVRIEPDQTEVVFVVEPGSKLLRAGSLRARFVEAGTKTPLSGGSYRIDAGSTDMGGLDENGALESSELAPGHVVLRVHKRGLASTELRLLLEPGEVRDLGEIEVETETWIQGTVHGPEGPEVGANVEHVAVDASTGEPLPQDGSVNWSTTDEGSFRIGRLSRHLYRVTVRPQDKGLARSSKLVDLRSGVGVDGLRFDLVPAVPLVISTDEREFVDIEYTLRDERGEFVLRSRVWQAEPFPLPLAPGRYTLLCERDGAPLGAPHEVVLVDRAVSLQLP